MGDKCFYQQIQSGKSISSTTQHSLWNQTMATQDEIWMEQQVELCKPLRF